MNVNIDQTLPFVQFIQESSEHFENVVVTTDRLVVSNFFACAGFCSESASVLVIGQFKHQT